MTSKERQSRKESLQRWRSKPENKAKRALWNKRWRANNPDYPKKRRAYYQKHKAEIRLRRNNEYVLKCEEIKARVNKYRLANLDKISASKRKAVFGITSEQYNAMLAAQNELCAICKKPETIKRNGKVKRLAVDHDHRTLVIRALLCHRCNVALGYFNDDPLLLTKARQYLIKHRAQARDQ